LFLNDPQKVAGQLRLRNRQTAGRCGDPGGPGVSCSRVRVEDCDQMPSPTVSRPSPVLSHLSTLRLLACLAVLGLLAACATTNGGLSASQEAARYQAMARRYYPPPGPPSDPWGPYIVEASNRYDVPIPWIRQVMRAESGGRVFDTSSAGAMGLMQVMPDTYRDLRAQYGLGDDPYNPHDNIMAGTAYLRQMYDLYGFPGFLAAYNAGPGRLDDYLTRNRPLPDETRHYVAKIAPSIVGISPNHPAPAASYAMNQLPIDIPPGPRYPRPPHRHPAAMLAESRSSRSLGRGAVQTTELAELPPPPPLPQPAARHGGFRLIAPAMAETLPVRRGGATGASGKWAIQVGAYGNPGEARQAAEQARAKAASLLSHAQPMVGRVQTAHAVLYRARLLGLSRDAAIAACEKIGHDRGACMVLSPDVQG
jgi:hypothetical protein